MDTKYNSTWLYKNFPKPERKEMAAPFDQDSVELKSNRWLQLDLVAFALAVVAIVLSLVGIVLAAVAL
jgi:hypothetical protein